MSTGTADSATAAGVTISDHLESIDAHERNQLNSNHEPFLSHEFLVALERHGCLGTPFGMIDQALDFACAMGFSGLHWLFTNAEDSQLLIRNSLIRRMGCQYHWYNNNYRDFEHFLQAVTSRKRKNVRRERRRVKEQCMMEQECDALMELSPYRQESLPPGYAH